MNRPVFYSARFLILLLIAALIIGCQLTASTGVTSKPTDTPAALTLPPTALLSPTAPPVLQETAPTASPLPAASAIVQPSLSPGPTIEHIVKGPFQKFTRSMGLPSGDLNDLWMDETNTVWLAASSGVFSGSQGLWQLRLDQRAVQILGSDARGRVWVLLDNGDRIAYNDAVGWHLFDQAEGWDPLPDPEYPSPGFAAPPAVDNLDQVWFATGANELRRFETKTSTWKTFTAQEIGYAEPDSADYQGHFITDVVTSSAGKVWVSDCIGEGEVLRGQGVRRLDDQTWNPAPPTVQECVLDMAVDSLDRIWVSAFDRVLRYDPLAGSWDELTLPAGRRALVTRITLDHKDIPWIEVARAGGASLFGSVERYHLKGNEWVLDEETGFYTSATLAFDKDNQAWFCSDGQVSLFGISGVMLPYGKLNTSSCRIAFDNSGQGWLLALGGQDAGLWWFSP